MAIVISEKNLVYDESPIFRQLAPDLAGEALVLLTPNSGQTPLFRGALVAFTGMLLRGPQFRSGSALGPVSRPPRIAAPGRFFGSPWWPPPAPCSVALNCGLAAWAGIPAPPNSGPRPLFRGTLVAPAGGLLRGPQLRSGPRIAAPGRFFGAPWWPPPEACSGALNCGLAARAGIPAPPNSGPRPLFRGALVAPAGGLLRGPQLRSGSEGRYPGPPNSGPRPLFRGARQRPAPGPSISDSLAIGRNRDHSGPAQQISVPHPAHLRCETDYLATIHNTNRRRAAVG